jgi:hypothetical protein
MLLVHYSLEKHGGKGMTTSDRFMVSGRVCEEESGQGVPGLIVKAYDKDLLFDDRLGSALTDEEGKFSLFYSRRDFADLFESRPDIYLAVYASPDRRLIDTQERVRWAASEHEEFEIIIDRETLGNLSPARRRDDDEDNE